MSELHDPAAEPVYQPEPYPPYPPAPYPPAPYPPYPAYSPHAADPPPAPAARATAITVGIVSLVLAVLGGMLGVLQGMLVSIVGDVDHHAALYHRLAGWLELACALCAVNAVISIVLLAAGRSRRSVTVLLVLIGVCWLAIALAGWRFAALSHQYRAG